MNNLKTIIKSKDIIEEADNNVEPNVDKAECKSNQEKGLVKIATVRYCAISHLVLRSNKIGIN